MATVHGSTRREFLAAGGVAGAALLAACSRRREPGPNATEAAPLVTRTLGRTGLKVPIVNIGSSYEAGIVSAALDAGLTYVHTSGSYADQNHERMLSRVFRGRSRESFLVGSSPDLPEYRFECGGLSADLGRRADASTIALFCEGSLQRLGVTHLDLYFLASINDPATVLHEPYMKAYEALKRAGTIRFAGIATHRNEPAVIRAAAKSGVWDVVLTALDFRQSYREDVRAAIHEAAEAGLGMIALKTQAGVYWDSRRQQKIDMQAAQRWVLRDEHVHSSVPAFSNHDELEEDLAVARNPSPRLEDERLLTAPSQAGLPGLYCQQCATCLSRCPAHADVPALMRAHMYAAGHGRPAHALHVLRGCTARDMPPAVGAARAWCAARLDSTCRPGLAPWLACSTRGPSRSERSPGSARGSAEFLQRLRRARVRRVQLQRLLVGVYGEVGLAVSRVGLPETVERIP